jgi:putative transcriptional regulator
MAIIVNLDVMMARRKMSLNELSEKVDLTLIQSFNLKNRKSKSNTF